MTAPGASDLPITTGFELPGATVRDSLGVCFGLVVRSMGIAKGFTASFSALRQGEVIAVHGAAGGLAPPRDRPDGRQRRLLGADGIVAMRFDSSEMGQNGLTEIVAYGTAVTLDRA